MNRVTLLVFALFLTAFITSCSDYGEKVVHNAGDVYYKEPVTEEEANKLGKYLAENGYFDGIEKSVQLLKEGDYYTVNFVVKEGASSNPENINIFKSFSPILSYDVFDGAIVNVAMCNETFESEYLIAGFNYGRLMKFGDDKLYYTDKIEEEKAEALGNFLRQSGFFQGTGLSAQITKEGNLYQFKYVVKPGLEKDETYKVTARAFGIMISGGVFNNEKLDVHLCDDFFNTLTTVLSE